ncbi:hypothetical protein ACHWQZ_G014399 [Mnemiopsis leidyi]
MNLQSILDYIPSASTDELRNILNAVQNELPKRQGNVNKYVEYIEDFCSDSQLLDMVWEECQSMELPTKRSKTGSMWLSSGKAPYVYTDTNPVHKATDIASFPCINRLLSLVNLSTEVTGPLDSCLVLKYTSKSSSLSIHDDGEDFIDQEKSICSFSLGCERTLEFFDKASKSKSKCTMSYRMKNNSMVVMRPGAQQNLKHAMRAERSSNIDDDQIRYSLSFRAVSKPKQGSAPNNNTSQCQNDVIEPPTEHVTLVAGDSYAARLDAVRLGKKKCKVVNVAQGGAKMDKNVQGLVPFGELSNEHPMLDTTKCLEIVTYLRESNTDIAILNETWLKNTISDSELLSTDHYKIFRADRSPKTHPPDLSNPNRFRKYGGGVLIAVRTDLQLTSKQIRLDQGAEILAVEFTTPTGIKFIICTCYRVGTLGMENHKKVIGSLNILIKRKKLNKIFFLGDLNLGNVIWPAAIGSTPIEQSFVDSFIDLGLLQCIKEPTHSKGKILDVLLTNSIANIKNLIVGDKDFVCRSDHSHISFNINFKIDKKKPVKRLCYNFKNVSWGSLNRDLTNVNWDSLLSCTEPEIGWRLFKNQLFSITDRYVKKSYVKSDNQDPWFDSECYAAWRTKIRKHKNRNKSDADSLKFSLARKKLKNLVAQKMCDTLNEDDDSALITKKFWSYVKSKSASQRIPEFVCHQGVVRNSPEDQANLFNQFFFEQFSEESTYDIDIDFSNDADFDIEFHHDKVRRLLENINGSMQIKHMDRMEYMENY